jgi:hypothetical protein
MTENIEHVTISLPDQKNNVIPGSLLDQGYAAAYGLAFKLAGEELSGLEDLESQCRRSNSVCRNSGSSRLISLQYMNRTYQVILPGITIRLEGSAADVELRDKILILHYLTRAHGTLPSNKVITYQELRQGATYFPSFFKRAVQPLIDYFGRSPERILEASKELGGRPATYGDVAVTIPAFTRVPVTLVLWKGDQEFPPNGSILFDSNILDYLSVEDINVLCQTITWFLVKSLPKLNAGN